MINNLIIEMMVKIIEMMVKNNALPKIIILKLGKSRVFLNFLTNIKSLNNEKFRFVA
jgi:hypothetical protein